MRCTQNGNEKMEEVRPLSCHCHQMRSLFLAHRSNQRSNLNFGSDGRGIRVCKVLQKGPNTRSAELSYQLSVWFIPRHLSESRMFRCQNPFLYMPSLSQSPAVPQRWPEGVYIPVEGGESRCHVKISPKSHGKMAPDK